MSKNSSPVIPFWGRISFLWLLLVPIVCAMYTLLLPIAPNDFWYNVRAGSVISQTGQIPTTALFTTSLPAGTPYYYQSWIAQVLLFKTLQFGGLSGIILLRTICLTASFSLLVWLSWTCARQVSARASQPLPETSLARIVALSCLLAYSLAASNMDVRPQTFSVLLFTVWMVLIFKWSHVTHKTRLTIAAALVLLMALWANTHGAFFTGLVVLASFFIGEALHFSLSRKRPQINRIFGTPPTSSSVRALGILVALCTLAPLLNPRGAMIYFYVFKLAGLKAGQKFIQEWQSPSFNQWYGALFFISLIGVFVLAGVLLRRAKPAEQNAPEWLRGAMGARPGEMAILVVMAILALRDIRSIIWFALLLAPVMAAMYTRLLLNRTRPTATEDSPPKSVQVVNAIIAMGLIFSCIPLLPAYKPGLGLPPEYTSHFAPNPAGQFPLGFSSDPKLLLDRDTPVEAVEYLRKNPPRGRLWNDMVFGSYLVWAGAPQALPHCDPRVEMYPLAFWEEYGRLIDGPPDAARTLRAQGFSDALLHVKDEKPLIVRLQKSGWRALLKKGNAILLRDANNTVDN
nr:hypothetical protein [uncultured bacterium]